MRPRLAEQALRRRAKWAFVLVIAASTLAGGWLQQRAAAQPEQELDWDRAPNALELALSASDAETGAATFRWSFAPTRERVVCTLDADGDGELDYRLADCGGQSEVMHRFGRGEEGVFFATMQARSDDGRTGLARARVEVR